VGHGFQQLWCRICLERSYFRWSCDLRMPEGCHYLAFSIGVPSKCNCTLCSCLYALQGSSTKSERPPTIILTSFPSKGHQTYCKGSVFTTDHRIWYSHHHPLHG
jgi:hypothetical protein